MYTLNQFLEEAEISISSYDTVTEAAKNSHMMHIEDSVLYGGVKGVRAVIDTLREVRDTMGGTGAAAITTKFDGAPAIFFGYDPSDGEFFVAKKGVFKKDPKLYKSDADIDADVGGKGGLPDLFKIALKELPKLGLKKSDGVIQGDVMFTKNTKKVEDIDGKKHITFHPNTLVYAVPTDTPLGKKIKAADFGVVIHTQYSGKSFESMSASFNVDGVKTKKAPSVWIQTANIDNVSDAVQFTDSDYKALTSSFSVAGKLFQKISGSVLKKLEANQPYAQLLEQYNNTLVRKGEKVGNTKAHAKGFINWISARIQKDIDSKKSATGKARAAEKGQKTLDFYASIEKDLSKLYDLQNALVVAKSLVINKLDSISSLKKFILKKDGYHATNDEGFVAINSSTGNAVKLVDRLTFSSNNFSADVIKSWQH
jgi:hypothetical protein